MSRCAVDAADTGDIEDLTEEDSAGESEGKSVFSASGDASDTDKEIRIEEIKKDEVKQDKETEIAPSLSSEMRERLCLRAEPEKSADVVLHPVLVEEWKNWMQKGFYEGDEDDGKKREEEENKLREEIMKKFPKKGELHVEAPKLNPEILAYMSGTAKNRDKHFVFSQNALGSAMIAVAKSISLILELEEDDLTGMLLQLLGNAGKLMADLYYQQSMMRRAFILAGIDKKYRELLKKLDITSDLFGKDLFKRLKHKISGQGGGRAYPSSTSQEAIEDIQLEKPKEPAKKIQEPLTAGSKIRRPTKIPALQRSPKEFLLEQQRPHKADEVGFLEKIEVKNVAG